MQAEQIKLQLQQHLADSHVDVDGDGHHFYATVVSPVFEGQSRVARQQLVYQILNEQIKSGELHAISFKTYTPEELEVLENKGA
jgi:acid stress-induced BolA-like protein IbaG/YrbA